MVKKLFKHEILSYLRIMVIVYAILLAIAGFGRILQFFESDSTVYSIVSGFSVLTYVVTIFVALGFSLVLGIVRFYKNLFTGEGYLSFTLPVTATQHIAVKVLTASLFQIVTFLVVVLSGCIITAGDLLVEILNASAYLIDKLYRLAGFHTVIYGFELLVIFIITVISEFLLYYTFIAIGQTFRKNRILAAVGAYFVYYIIYQIIGTVITVFVTLFAEKLPFEQISAFIEAHPLATLHIAFCGMILLILIFATVYFIVTRLIINKKLNLE